MAMGRIIQSLHLTVKHLQRAPATSCLKLERAPVNL